MGALVAAPSITATLGTVRSDSRRLPVAARSRASATARQTASPGTSPRTSSTGSSSQAVSTSQHPSTPGSSRSDSAVTKASESASGPPPTPMLGPWIRRPTLTALANAWSEHWGTTCGETVTGPPSRRLTSVRALAGRPAPQGAATTAKRSLAPARGFFGLWPIAAIASWTARMPTTVCSSAWRRKRGGSGGAPSTGASRSAPIPAARQVTVAWTATGQERWGVVMLGDPRRTGGQAALRTDLAAIFVSRTSSRSPTEWMPSRSSLSIWMPK